ncbi:MAG: H-X9-DG-CTERM domain-containing protein, partial [Planctomycetota bacterium]
FEGFNAAFFDGSVRFLSSSMDMDLLRALMTRAGGEQVPYLP